MKRYLTITLLLLWCAMATAQTDRIRNIQNHLEALAVDHPEFNEKLKLEADVDRVSLPNFLMAVSRVHGLNLSVGGDIDKIDITNNFSDVTVADLLTFLCKEYGLTIDFTGNILAIKRFDPPRPEPVERTAHVDYDPTGGLISIDASADPLDRVFRKVMEVSGQNLLYASGLNARPISGYLNKVPFDRAMEKLAETNGLLHSKSRDGFHLFSDQEVSTGGRASRGRGPRPDLGYQVLDTVNKILNVDLFGAPIADVIDALGLDLGLDVYTATPLEGAGTVTFNAKGIHFDDLLAHIFESAPATGQAIAPANGEGRQRGGRRSGGDLPAATGTVGRFTFKKENDIYFFGAPDQLSLRKVEIVQMMHRSVELPGDPSGGGRSAGRTSQGSVNFFGGGNDTGNPTQRGSGNRRPLNTSGDLFGNYQSNAEALVNILPEEVKADLDIRVDLELNSFFVSGPASNIERFKHFIKQIDRPVPVVLIEVMIIEVRRSAIVETGISWGIGDAPTRTRGGAFPALDMTLGAGTINKVIGGFDGFGSFNIGKVVPEFFATIKAMEENGNIKIRSTPKLSTLNGHRAHLSIGETTYYVVTNQNFFGSQVPQTSQIRNYAPIDAELGVSIKPYVSGDGQVTLDINVIQSDFSGERIEDDAPPGLTSREFSSIIRMQDRDMAILGGLEEKVRSDSGNGVPLLSRIPILKWFFSQRKREDSKQKLTILIKPTVIY